MQDYDKARNELAQALYDKLMIDRFGWEINIGADNYILEIPITKEEFVEKKLLVEKVVRELIHEYDVYRYRCDDPDNDPRAIPTPTIFNVQIMSVAFDDTPIDMTQAYEVNPEDINRTVDKKHTEEYHNSVKIENVIQFWKEQKDEDLPHMQPEVVKVLEKLAYQDGDPLDDQYSNFGPEVAEALAELGVPNVAKQD